MDFFQKQTQLIFLLICLWPAFSMAQVGINSTGADPDASAMLDVSSTDKGILIPRMTEVQRDQINNPADGLMVYVIDDSSFHYFDGISWISLASSSETIQSLSLIGTNLSISNGNTITLPSSTDDLGNHEATQNLQLKGNWLSNDGENEGIFVTADGKVGIGKNDPQAPLDINGSLIIDDQTPGIIFYEEFLGTSRRSLIENSLTNGTTPGVASQQKMRFYVSDGGNSLSGMTEVMTLRGDGNVGIGVVDPTKTLDVDGQLRIRGGSPAKGYVLTSEDANGNASWQAPKQVDFASANSVKSLSNNDNWDSRVNAEININGSTNVKIEALATLRLTAGSGLDPFEIRVRVDWLGFSGSPSGVYQETTTMVYEPGEFGVDHNNRMIVPYLEIDEFSKRNNTGNTETLRFTLQIRNTGDDAWESSNVRLIVTEL